MTITTNWFKTYFGQKNESGPCLTFNPANEKFVIDKQVDSFLKRNTYRKPYIFLDVV
jgi:hypothetical protein